MITRNELCRWATPIFILASAAMNGFSREHNHALEVRTTVALSNNQALIAKVAYTNGVPWDLRTNIGYRLKQGVTTDSFHRYYVDLPMKSRSQITVRLMMLQTYPARNYCIATSYPGHNIVE